MKEANEREISFFLSEKSFQLIKENYTYKNVLIF